MTSTTGKVYCETCGKWKAERNFKKYDPIPQRCADCKDAHVDRTVLTWLVGDKAAGLTRDGVLEALGRLRTAIMPRDKAK